MFTVQQLEEDQRQLQRKLQQTAVRLEIEREKQMLRMRIEQDSKRLAELEQDSVEKREAAERRKSQEAIEEARRKPITWNYELWADERSGP